MMNNSQDDSKKHVNQQSLIALEEQIAFQQRHLEELNSVVREQQTSLDRMQRELSQFRELLQRAIERGGEDLPHEKPPHY